MRPLTVLRNVAARRRVLSRMGIRPGDLVLEVGSGQNPNPRADVLCDRYLLDDTERNQEAVVVDRPFVIGDIYRLPFRTGAFDFVICAHVLEHLEDPGRAAAELGRVARRGYVEVPSRENEMLLPFPFHRWMIDREGDELVFRPKPDLVPDPGMRDWFRSLSAQVPGFHDLFFQRLHDLGNVHGVVWEGILSLRVDGAPGPVGAEAVAPDREEEVRSLRSALAMAASRRPAALRLLDRLVSGRQSPPPELAPLLACPGCQGTPLVGEGGSWLACPACAATFPVVAAGARSVPYLVQ